MNKPVYEIIKVTKRKVFIVGLGNPCITDDLKFVYEELNKIYPNKRIIFIDEIGDSLEWWEILEDFSNNSYEIVFGQYIEKIPNIKTWDDILDKVIKH